MKRSDMVRAKEYAESCDNESGSFLSYQLKAIREKAFIAGMNSRLSGCVKPKKLIIWDGDAECVSEDYDDHGGGAFCVRVDCPSIYDANNVRKLIGWLEKAANWIENKERYNRFKPRMKSDA